MMLTLEEVLEDFKRHSRLPVARNVGVNSQNSSGETPLHYMAMIGDHTGIRLLLAAGAEIDAKDLAGNAPLHLAVENIQKTAVMALLQGGAKLLVYNASGKTPLDLCSHPNMKWMQDILEAYLPKT